MQSWATAAKDHLQPDPGDDEPDGEPAGPERSLHLSETMDGRGEMSASLDPEGRALTETAIRLAQTEDSDAEPERSPARRRGDALVDIMRFFLDHLGPDPIDLEQISVIESTGVTHLRYRVIYD
jgi:hypothetical protein